MGFSLEDTDGYTIGNLTSTGNELQPTAAATLTTTNANCDGTGAADGTEGSFINVVREAKDPNDGSATNVDPGQIGIIEDSLGNAENWPFIQLYEFNPTGNVVIQYNKGGGVQSTTLTFDTVDQYAGLTLDRAVYPQGAQVHATITDLWLNIDPTDEDSWTFSTNINNATITDGSAFNVDTFYQVFDENGQVPTNNDINDSESLRTALGDLMCEDNCVLKIDTNAQDATNPVLTIQDNGDTDLNDDDSDNTPNDATSFNVAGNTAELGDGSIPVTFTEQGPNSGVFGTYDESDVSNLKITSNAARGTSASIDYNETPVTILVGFDFATIDIQPVDDEWSSGEEISVVIVDGDQNKNSRSDEDLDLDNPAVSLIPALTTGDPFTLGEGDTDTIQVVVFNGSQTTSGATNVLSGTSTADTVGAVYVFETQAAANTTATATIQAFSDRAIITDYDAEGSDNTDAEIGMNAVEAILLEIGTDMEDLKDSLMDTSAASGVSFNYIHWDVRSTNVGDGNLNIYLVNSTSDIIDTNFNYCNGNSGPDCTAIMLVDGGDSTGYVNIGQGAAGVATSDGGNFISELFAAHTDDDDQIGILLNFTTNVDLTADNETSEAIVVDFFSFGFTDDGVQSSERVANQIIRIEAEETGDNTGTFEGSLEYIMVNQLNIQSNSTFGGLTTIADDPNFIVIEDLTDEDAPRVSYNDLGADGVVTPVSDQEEAPSHSGVVSLNQDSYKIADTVVITLEDLDLNVDSDLVDIFTVTDVNGDDAVGSDNTQSLTFGELGRLLDVTFDDIAWSNQSACTTTPSDNNGLEATGFTLVETGTETGVFVGDFQIPSTWCRANTSGTEETTTGLDIEVNYVDFRDASGEIVEVGDSAGVRANTGSVSLDRTVYPVPFGTSADADGRDNAAPNGRSLFPIHASGIEDNITTGDGEELPTGDLTIHVRINDPDFDVNPTGEDEMNQDNALKISVIRGSDSVILGYAGAAERDEPIDVDGDETTLANIRSFGPISEIAPDAGIYELDVVVKFTDGPESTQCANHSTEYTQIGDGDGDTDETEDVDRFDSAATSGTEYCILQGDILQVEYTDPADASGDENTVTDSATFDLRNGVLQSDKSVYIIGSDMILTLIEPDFDLDNDSAETYDLDLIEWDSDAATLSMGDQGGEAAAFDP
jgi:hypothetical protein